MTAPADRPRTAVSWRAAMRCAAAGIIVAAALLLPFLNKAFAVDDPYFLLMARQILHSPLRPLSVNLCWFGSEMCAKASDLGPSDALGGYFLVPVILLGGSEIVAHILQLGLLCVAILETAMLAFRLGLGRFGATVAALTMAVSPAVLPFASSVMPDILAMTLGVAGLERLCAWKTGARAHQCAAAIACLGLAPCARPHLLLLLVPAALFIKGGGSCFSPKGWLRAPRRYWIPLIAAALLAWVVSMLYAEPGVALHPPRFLLSPENIRPNVRAFLIYLVLAVPFAVPWLVLRPRRAWQVLAAFIPVTAVFVWKTSVYPASQAWPAVLAALGATALTAVLIDAIRKREAVPLALALWLLIPLAAAAYVHVPIKYLAASGPAVAILMAKLLESDRRRFAVVAMSAFLVASATLSWLIVKADGEFAESARRVSAEVIAPRVGSGQRVWCAGEWGFYWYAQEAGARVSRPDGEVARSGDVLVVGRNETGEPALKRFPHRTLLERRTFYASGGRTLSPENHVGFYSNTQGELPWGWAPGELNRYEVWRIDDGN